MTRAFQISTRPILTIDGKPMKVEAPTITLS